MTLAHSDTLNDLSRNHQHLLHAWPLTAAASQWSVDEVNVISVLYNYRWFCLFISPLLHICVSTDIFSNYYEVVCYKYFVLSCSSISTTWWHCYYSLDYFIWSFCVPPIQISQDEYDRLRQLEFSQTCHSSTHISSSGIDAYIVSSYKPWILNSGASYHITGITDKFISLHLSNQFPSIDIVDGTQSLVLVNGYFKLLYFWI